MSLWGETPDIGVMFHCGDAYATVVSGEVCRVLVVLGCGCGLVVMALWREEWVGLWLWLIC